MKTTDFIKNMDQKFDILKKFFETDHNARRALGLLSKGVEIGITHENGAHWALVITPLGPQLLDRHAQSPDVSFRLNDISIERLCQTPMDGPEDLAVAILREIKNKNIRLSITGSFVGIATKGYFSIIRLGGKKMWDYLTEHGITNFFKITQIIKRMINKQDS